VDREASPDHTALAFTLLAFPLADAINEGDIGANTAAAKQALNLAIREIAVRARRRTWRLPSVGRRSSGEAC